MIELDVMGRCLEFFNGRPDEWKAYEGEGRCSKCERNQHSVCVDDMRGGPHCCVATIHAPGNEPDAEELAGMVAWQIQLFASPKNARAVLAALRAAEKMADGLDRARDYLECRMPVTLGVVDEFRKAMRGEL